MVILLVMLGIMPIIMASSIARDIGKNLKRTMNLICGSGRNGQKNIENSKANSLTYNFNRFCMCMCIYTLKKGVLK